MRFNPPSTNIAPESAYNTASNQLAARLERLEDLLAQLSHRLMPVLVPLDDGKALERGDQAMKAAPAPLVSMLEHHAARTDNLGDEVCDLLQRLCL